MPKDKDATGFDPVKWVSRLRDVAESSQFTQEAKDVIEDVLSDLQKNLEKMK
jgi:hypothetical protein